MEAVGGCPWSPTALRPFKPAAGWFEVLEQLGMNLELLDGLPHRCMLLEPSGPARDTARWAAGAEPGWCGPAGMSPGGAWTLPELGRGFLPMLAAAKCQSVDEQRPRWQ